MPLREELDYLKAHFSFFASSSIVKLPPRSSRGADLLFCEAAGLSPVGYLGAIERSAGILLGLIVIQLTSMFNPAFDPNKGLMSLLRLIDEILVSPE